MRDFVNKMGNFIGLVSVEVYELSKILITTTLLALTLVGSVFGVAWVVGTAFSTGTLEDVISSGILVLSILVIIGYAGYIAMSAVLKLIQLWRIS